MADQTLNIIVQLKNTASTGLIGLNAVLSGMGKAVMGLAAQFKSLLRHLLSLQGLVLGVGLASLAKSFVTAASATEQFTKRLKILLGSASEAKALTKTLTELSGRVAANYDEVMAAAGDLATVVQGGRKEIEQWMPVLLDLSATSGMALDQVTQQFRAAYTNGIGAAMGFKKAGITAFLGFRDGVEYSAYETRKILLEAWNDPLKKLKGAALEMNQSWEGIMGDLGDAWRIFRLDVMDAGLFQFLKLSIGALAETIGGLKTGTLEYGRTVKSVSDTAISALETVALGVARVIDGWRGLKMAIQAMYLAWSHIAEVLSTGIRGVTILWEGFKFAVLSIELEISSIGLAFGKMFQWVLDRLAIVVNKIASAFAKLNTITNNRLGIDNVVLALQKVQSAFYTTGTTIGTFALDTARGVEEQMRQTEANINSLLSSGASDAEKFWQEEQRVAEEKLLKMAEELGMYDQLAIAFEALHNKMRASEVETTRVATEEAAKRQLLAYSVFEAAIDEPIAPPTPIKKAATEEEKKEAEKQSLMFDTIGKAAGSMADEVGMAYDLSGKKMKEFFIAQKAFAIAETLISTYSAAQKSFDSMAEISPVLGAAAAAAAVAQGMMRVAMIASQGLAVGGIVEGSSPSKTADNIHARLTAGEFVHSVDSVDYYGQGVMAAINARRIPRSVLQGFAVPGSAPASAGHRFAMGGSVARGSSGDLARAAAPAAPVINNIIDPMMMSQYVSSRPGEDDIVNVISRRSFDIKQLLR
jgi:hypothetical protein